MSGSMNRKDLIKQLKRLNFRKVGDGTNHEFWSDGHERLIIPRGGGSKRMTARNCKMTLVIARRSYNANKNKGV